MCFQVTNSKSKNKKFHFELLTQSWKILNFSSSYQLEVKLLFLRFRVTNSRLKNKKIHFELLTRWVHFFNHFPAMNVKLRNEKNSLNITVSKWQGLRHSIVFFFVFNFLFCKCICGIYLSMLDFNRLRKFKNIFTYKITEGIQ